MDRQQWDRRYDKRELVWSAEPNRLLSEEVTAIPPGLALDLGTGEGRNAIWLAARGWQVTAVDFSAVAIDKARRLEAGRGVSVEWLVEDVTRYRPAVASFDLVVMCFLHLPRDERERLIDAAAAALRSGGTFLYIGHDISNIADGIGGPQDPEVLCAPAEVANQLVGMRIERAEVIRRPVAADGGHGDTADERSVALDTLVRATRAQTKPTI